MAKLLSLPNQRIINGFKGVIDYYVHDGVPCARSWPRPPSEPRSPAVQATWPAFAYAAKAWNLLSQPVRTAYNQTSAGTNRSGKDLFMKSYIRDYFPPGHWPESHPPGMSQPYFAILDIATSLSPSGYTLNVITDIICLMVKYKTTIPPNHFQEARIVRGLPLMVDTHYTFEAWSTQEEESPTPSKNHHFPEETWPPTRTVYLTFRATLDTQFLASIGPIFTLNPP